MATDPSLADEVQAWREHLDPMYDLVPERRPPARVWSSIQQALSLNDGGNERAPSLAQRWWDSVALWRIGTFAAATCAVVLAVLLFRGTTVDNLPTVPPIDERVAVLNDAKERATWLVRLEKAPTRTRLVVFAIAPPQPAAGQSIRPDQSFELWAIPGPSAADSAPVSLGLLNPTGNTTFTIDATVVPTVSTLAALAVSLEPAGGSPTGAPTGPVLYQGAWY